MHSVLFDPPGTVVQARDMDSRKISTPGCDASGQRAGDVTYRYRTTESVLNSPCQS